MRALYAGALVATTTALYTVAVVAAQHPHTTTLVLALVLAEVTRTPRLRAR